MANEHDGASSAWDRYAGEPAVIAAHDQLAAAMQEAARVGSDADDSNAHGFEVLHAFASLIDVERVIDERRRGHQ